MKEVKVGNGEHTLIYHSLFNESFKIKGLTYKELKEIIGAV